MNSLTCQGLYYLGKNKDFPLILAKPALPVEYIISSTSLESSGLEKLFLHWYHHETVMCKSLTVISAFELIFK